MRLLGLLCVVLACACAGMYASHTLHREADALDRLLSLIGDCAAYIRTLQPELPELLRMLAEIPAYRDFRFLCRAGERLHPGALPSTVWETAVREDRSIPRPAKEPLCRMGAVLGTTDVTGQLAALSLTQSELERMALQAHERSNVQGKLYRSLGLLGGAMLAVILL